MEVKSKASGGLAGAEERIFGGGVTDFLASYAVLLVGELKGRVSDPEDSLVIQRRGRGGVDLAIDVEVDIHEAEGLGATVFQGVGVFSGSEEPEEGKVQRLMTWALVCPHWGCSVSRASRRAMRMVVLTG